MDKKVMIVEDSLTVRYEVKLLLQELDVSVVEASNELGMLNMMEEYGKCVDLIIMDLTLKRENGFDLIKKLRESEKYKSIPVLILTEHANKVNVLKAKELEVQGYLRKPIQKEELIDRVKGVLENT
ncbi:MAG TPA: response regulator [Clostridia bacterium]|nr:response regulator [Clostridia bacterium]